MDLKTAKILTIASMILSVACAFIGIVGYSGAEPGRMYFAIAAFALMALAMLCLFAFCRCPWCGKRLTSGLMQLKVCPRCNRDLETGLRAKGKKKR